MEIEVIREILDLTKRSPYVRNRLMKTEREEKLMEQLDKFIEEFNNLYEKLSQHPHTKKTRPGLLKELFPTLSSSEVDKLVKHINRLTYNEKMSKKFTEIQEGLNKINKEQIDALMDPSTGRELYISLYSPERVIFFFIDSEIKFDRKLLIETVLSRAENSIGINRTCTLLLLYYQTLYEQIKKYDPFTKFKITPSEYETSEEFIKTFSNSLESLLKTEEDDMSLDIEAYKLTKIISKYVTEDLSLVKEIAKIMMQKYRQLPRTF